MDRVLFIRKPEQGAKLKRYTRFKECYTYCGCESKTGVVTQFDIIHDRLMFSHIIRKVSHVSESFPLLWLNIGLYVVKLPKHLPPPF